MSSPRYGWWSYAKAMIRSYPQLHREYEQLHSQKVTASISGMPGGGGASRTTEDVALRQLPPAQQKDCEAVSLALAEMKKRSYGKEFMKMVQMRYWQKPTPTLEMIGERLHYSESTMRRWNKDFIRLVLKFRGLRD